jgi:Tfp pilus assembly protein PilO
MSPVVNQILAWISTSGLVLVVGWAFSVAGDIRQLSNTPGRVAAIEQRLNAVERQQSADAETIKALREKIEDIRGLPQRR